MGAPPSRPPLLSEAGSPPSAFSPRHASYAVDQALLQSRAAAAESLWQAGARPAAGRSVARAELDRILAPAGLGWRGAP
eukprot:453204-Prymnesium_polylepis.3